MPINVLEGNSFSSKLGKVLGQSIGSVGAGFALKRLGKEERERKELEKKKIDLLKKSSKVRPGVKSFLSMYDPNKEFDPSMIGNLEEMSKAYVEQGLEPDDAISAAYNDLIHSGVQQESPETKSEFAKAFQGRPIKEVGKDVLDTAKDVGKGLLKGGRIAASYLSFPQDVKHAFMRAMGIEPPAESLIQAYDKLTKGEAQPQNMTERLAYGLPFGAPGVAAEYARETLESAGLPESVQHAGSFVTFILSHGMRFPKLREILSKSEKVAEKTGQPVEKVIADAQEKSGITVESLASGDEAAINEFKSKITEVPEVAKKVEETPKQFFKKKDELRQREVFGSKLADSPLSEYYEIKEKEAHREQAKRPETRAREEEIRNELRPKEEKLFNDLRDQKEQLARIEREIKNTNPENLERLNLLRDYQLRKYNQTLESLKDVQYEMKYGRPRPTEAEIDAQIEKSLNEIKEGIKNPTPENTAKLEKQLENDKKYLDRASKLTERGELPGEIRPDTHIKMKQKYLDAYKEALKDARAEMKELKGEKDEASLRRYRENKELADILKNRIKRLEADIINQKDKIKSMRALEKPSGAFYKIQIQSLKKDNALFSHDLIKFKKVKSQQEFKTHQAASRTLKEIEKGRALAKEPTPEKLEQAAEEAGKPKSEFIEAYKEMKEGVAEVEKPIKEGTVSPSIEAKFLKKAKYVAKGLGVAFGIGTIVGLSEEILGFRIPPGVVKVFTRGQSTVSLGPTTWGRNFVRSFFDEAQADELNKLRGKGDAFNQYVRNMEKSYDRAKARRVVKLANEKQSAKRKAQ